MSLKFKFASQAAYLLLVTVFLLHLPFLQADPDLQLSDSRDAFTDEGLNTSQLRNDINHGQLNFEECANLVKTPLFNLFLFFPLSILGTRLAVARLTILLLVFLQLIFTMRASIFRELMIILCITTLLQYYVFQYSHFSMSEMLSVGFIFSAMYCLYLFINDQHQNKKLLFVASLLMALAYYSKIQFIYVLPLIPFILLAKYLINKGEGTGVIATIKPFFMSATWAILFIAIYIVCWYLPHQSIFDFVLQDETAGKFASITSIPRTVAFNIVYVLFTAHTWPLNLLYILCFFLGILIWKTGKGTPYRTLFLIAICWMLFEMHKLSMIYLPSRYLVSYYFAGGFMSAVVLKQTLQLSASLPIYRNAGKVLLVLFFIVNAVSYVTLLSGRQFNLKNANDYFSKTLHNLPDALVLGSWAPSFTWGSKAITKPVWYHYMNDENILEQHPTLILSEPDEAESNRAYAQNNIQLYQHADSTRRFAIGKWEVIAYWITPR